MKRIRKIILWMVIAFFSSTVFAVLLFRFAPVPISPLMLLRCVEQHQQGRELRIVHQWVPLSQISPYLPRAVIASEDQNFVRHHGFDFAAIEAAAREGVRGGRRRGGSTISQQTAKNVFLWPSRTWLRKGLEAYFTLLIETFWSKERIMEVYLNTIEMGDGLYGAEAVSQTHFGVNASLLTKSQCALVAATLPNPRRYSSMRPSPYVRKRQRWIEKQMKHVESIATNQ